MPRSLVLPPAETTRAEPPHGGHRRAATPPGSSPPRTLPPHWLLALGKAPPRDNLCHIVAIDPLGQRNRSPSLLTPLVRSSNTVDPRAARQAAAYVEREPPDGLQRTRIVRSSMTHGGRCQCLEPAHFYYSGHEAAGQDHRTEKSAVECVTGDAQDVSLSRV